jgi:hypothetical protein
MFPVFDQGEKDANLTQVHFTQSSIILPTPTDQHFTATCIGTFIAK